MSYLRYIILNILVSTILQYVNAGDTPQNIFPVIPAPVSVEYGEGSFNITQKTIWRTTSPEQRSIVRNFSTNLASVAGWKNAPKMESYSYKKENYYSGKKGHSSKKQVNTIDILIDGSMPHEAYRIDISPSVLRIYTNSNSGLQYALQTISAYMEKHKKGPQYVFSIPEIRLYDYPNSLWRGIMLDVSRCFIPKDDILKLLDILAIHKINKLHLYIAGDNGWRVEIKKYPELTATGAWRVPRNEYFPLRKNENPGEIPSYGGFYTQKDIKDIVNYAAERNIDVIPAIDIPVNASALLAAYPNLTCPVVPKPITVPAGSGRGHSCSLCAGNEEVYSFIQNVLMEIENIFLSPYIHITDNGIAPEQWETCPRCNTRMRLEKYDNTGQLSGYFINRITSFIARRGKLVIKQNDIMPFNLDTYQGPQWFEPRAYGGDNTLYDVFKYDLKSKNSSYKINGILGVLNTDFIQNREDMEYMLLPRLAALSEVAWSGKAASEALTTPEALKASETLKVSEVLKVSDGGWQDFLNRLDKITSYYDSLDITYSRAMFNIQHQALPVDNKSISLTLKNIRPDMEIRYSVDGSELSAGSFLYDGPVILNPPVGLDTLADAPDASDANGKKEITVKANTFRNGIAEGQPLVLPVFWHKATAKPVKIYNNTSTPGISDNSGISGLSGLSANSIGWQLVNGVRGSDRHTDGEWVLWAGKNARIDIDLLEITDISSVETGLLLWSGACIQLPSKIIVMYSDDGIKYETAGEVSIPAEVYFEERLALLTLPVSTPGLKSRYLRVELLNPGFCPKGHINEGEPAVLCVDEVLVY